MVMGKGGVGKTTIAAAIAVTWPRAAAASISAPPIPPRTCHLTLAGDVPGLHVGRIDPAGRDGGYVG